MSDYIPGCDIVTNFSSLKYLSYTLEAICNQTIGGIVVCSYKIAILKQSLKEFCLIFTEIFTNLQM